VQALHRQHDRCAASEIERHGHSTLGLGSRQVDLPGSLRRGEHRHGIAHLVAIDPGPRKPHVDRAEPLGERMPGRSVAAEREPLPQVEIGPVAVDLQTAMPRKRERASVEAQRTAIELRPAVLVAKRQAGMRGA
jgi:hypothetical protein